MRFIRKNGRIIPIKDKQESTNRKIDFAQGVVSGAVTRHLIGGGSLGKKKAIGFNIATIGADIYTAQNRWRNRKSIGDFLKKEAVGWGIDFAGSAVGFAGSHGLINLAKKYKLSKMAKASAFATSKSAIPSIKLLGKSNAINAVYKVL